MSSMLLGMGVSISQRGAYGLFVGLASGAGRSCECNYMEPGVVFKQGSKTLTYHTCCADYTDIILFFHGNVSFLFLQ